MTVLYFREGAHGLEYSHDNSPGSFELLPGILEPLLVSEGTSIHFEAADFPFEPLSWRSLTVLPKEDLFLDPSGNAINPIRFRGTYTVSGTVGVVYRLSSEPLMRKAAGEGNRVVIMGETMTGHIKIGVGGGTQED